MYKILSLDGGGIRGLLTSVLLERLVDAFPPLLDQVDLIAGTSTGAILGLGLAKGLPPSAISGIYREDGPKIFHRTWLGEIENLDGLVGSIYPEKPRLDALRRTFGETRLKDLGKRVLVPSVDLDSAEGPAARPDLPREWKAKFFHNFPGPGSDGEETAVDVAMRSSAAPVYFPVYQGYVDGGLAANNPSVCALAQALRSKGLDSREAVVLSLGTGASLEAIPPPYGAWGLTQWGFRLVSLAMGAGEDVPDYQCRELLGACYLRVQPVLSRAIGLDDVGAIPELERIARDFDLGSCLEWLGRNWV